MSFHSAVVLGAGPIGLFAAIDARQNFVKDVTLVEKRSEYTRTNVPQLQPEIVKHIQDVGIADNLWKDSEAGSSIAFSKIEKELLKKALAIGVKMERGFTVQGLIGRNKNKFGRYKSITLILKEWNDRSKSSPMYGRGKVLETDFLVVCSGGAAAADPVVTQQLGFTFQRLKAKNYGAYGIFVPHKRGQGEQTEEELSRRIDFQKATRNLVAGQIGFSTPDHNYLLVTLTACPKKDFKFLKENTAKLKQVLLAVGNGISTSVLTEIKEVEKNMALFKIAIQRANQFYSPEYPAVLVGDAAVTPHPQVGSGIGTGFKGFTELQDLFRALKKADRSENNEGAFQNFNSAYELHVSKKALEGATTVVGNLVKMLTGYRDEMKAGIVRMSNTTAKRLIQDVVDGAENLIAELEDEKKRAKGFIDLLDGDDPELLDWDETVGQLWAEIDGTYRDVKNFTSGISLLSDHLNNLEPMLKLTA